MKMLVRRIPWCALLLLGCGEGSADDPDASAGGSAGAVVGGAAGALAGGSAGGSAAAGAPAGGGAGSGNAGTAGSTDGNGGAGGAPLVCAEPPSIDLVSPAPAEEVTPGAVSLEASTGTTSSSSSLTFYLRRVHEKDFTVVVLPDTQHYVINSTNQRHFVAQTEWITQNRQVENIVGVIHNGDIVNEPQIMSQWDNAEAAMSILEDPLPDYPDGVPYIVAVGNHDQEPMGKRASANNFNARFGVNRFSGRPYYKGHFGDRNDDSYIEFSAGSIKFLALALEYGNLSPDEQSWALEVIRSHPDHRVILDVHELIGASGNWTGAGESFYELVKAEPNLELMTCGHNLGESRRTDTFEGHTIHTMFANWQHLQEGGQGRLRVWRFSPTAGTLSVRTYSPSLDEEYTSDQSRFTLPFDMSDAAPEFAPVAVVGDVSGTATAMPGELDAGTDYEWYVEATDACGQVTTSETRTFSTK